MAVEYPTLDQATKDAVNGLPYDPNWNTSYAFGHELLWYGIDAVIHAHIIKEISRVAAHELDVDTLISNYGIEFGHRVFGPNREHDDKYGLTALIRQVENAGIFIPRQKYGGEPDCTILLFHSDHMHTFSHTGDVQEGHSSSVENAIYLTHLVWTKDTFLDKKMVKRCMRFARDVWSYRKVSFEKYQGGTQFTNPQPAHVTELGRRLIIYYDHLMDIIIEDFKRRMSSGISRG